VSVIIGSGAVSASGGGGAGDRLGTGTSAGAGNGDGTKDGAKRDVTVCKGVDVDAHCCNSSGGLGVAAFTALAFVPVTPGSPLARLLNRARFHCGFRLLVNSILLESSAVAAVASSAPFA
jgi:hypothetical protein